MEIREYDKLLIEIEPIKRQLANAPDIVRRMYWEKYELQDLDVRVIPLFLALFPDEERNKYCYTIDNWDHIIDLMQLNGVSVCGIPKKVTGDVNFMRQIISKHSSHRLFIDRDVLSKSERDAIYNDVLFILNVLKRKDVAKNSEATSNNGRDHERPVRGSSKKKDWVSIAHYLEQLPKQESKRR